MSMCASSLVLYITYILYYIVYITYTIPINDTVLLPVIGEGQLFGFRLG